MAYRIDNASKGMWQRINEMFAAWVPRQAVVTRNESSGVWVRFAPVDPTAPESWFPSTIANPAVGTSGWVFTLGGKKGLFIATGLPLVADHTHDDRYYTEAEVTSLLALAKPKRNRAAGSLDGAISTVGDRQVSMGGAAQGTFGFSGLQPSSTYSVEVKLWMRIDGAASTSGHIGFRTVGSAPAVHFHPVATSFIAGANGYSWSYEVEVQSSASGAITVQPYTRWALGTYTPRGYSMAVRVEPA